MRSQLRTHTRRIRYDDASAERALNSLEPGRSTVEAVERGCVLMLQGFARTQVEQAGALLGKALQFSLLEVMRPWCARLCPRRELSRTWYLSAWPSPAR